MTVSTVWFAVSRTREFSSAEVARFQTFPGMTCGSTTYLDVKLVTRQAENIPPRPSTERRRVQFTLSDPRGVTVVSAIASTAEAEWLVREMNQALGRSA